VCEPAKGRTEQEKNDCKNGRESVWPKFSGRFLFFIFYTGYSVRCFFYFIFLGWVVPGAPFHSILDFGGLASTE